MKELTLEQIKEFQNFLYQNASELPDNYNTAAEYMNQKFGLNFSANEYKDFDNKYNCMKEKVNNDNEVLIFDKDIYSLVLHEQTTSEMCWGTRVVVTRVPGGWIYQYKSRDRKQNFDGFDSHLGIVFVPCSFSAKVD